MPSMKDKAMSLLLFFLLFVPEVIEEKDSSRSLASSWTMIPSRSLAGLHYIFKDFEIREEEGLVKVSGPVVEITNGETIGAKVFKDGYTSEVDLEDFEEEQFLGLSVFEATSGTGTNVGTAFLVGQDIVLTNRHVMGIGPTEKVLPCGKFSVKLNHKDERIFCEKVRYCSRNFDYCAVELKKMANGLSVGAEVKPLRLSRKIKSSKDLMLFHIGNAAGLGIQASSGRGVHIREGEFYHYVPTLGGSSGAPIFNEKKEVVGINWAHTGGNYVDDASFNRGVLTETIFNEMKLTHPKTLRDIKSFRSWYLRSTGHRRVTIESR